MTTRIAINGFGRIGRGITRALFGRGERDLELVGINDLSDVETLAHLLQFDSVHGRFPASVSVDGQSIVIDGKRIPLLSKADPMDLPWKELQVDAVLECTGAFRSKELALGHVRAGAARVLISAPGGPDVDGTFCVGINLEGFEARKHAVISNASCTTNCLAPLAKVLHENFGLLKGHMVTVHSYTNDQRTLDWPHADLRRARAAGLSIIPTGTGAAKAIGLVLPELDGKLDGTSIRVPTPDVSLVCLSAHLSKTTTRDEVNAALVEAANGPLNGILDVETRPLVSCDFIGNPHSSIVDAAQTTVMGGDLVEVQSWYDNEWGFSNRMIDLALFVGKQG